MKTQHRSKPHILLISRFFPPSAAIAARRALRFARGLPGQGFRVTVLTTQERFNEFVDEKSDADGDESYSVVRTTTYAPIAGYLGRRAGRGGWSLARSSPDAERSAGGSSRSDLRRRLVRSLATLARVVLRPDEDLGWNPPALRAARALHRRDPLDAVMVSVPSYSSILAAARLARWARIPLVIDYRDPWAADRETSKSWSLHRALEAWQETRALRLASLVIFNSPTARDFYRERFPFLSRVEVLPNGIDRYVPLEGEMRSAPLTWIHAGNLYRGLRSLEPVVRAMAALRDEVDARLLLIGVEPAHELALAESLGIADRVVWLGRKPLDDTLRELRTGHRLVAVISPVHRFSIPAKLFDYLATSRPILLLCRADHAATRIVEGVDEHRVIDPRDSRAFEDLLREDAAQLRSGGLRDLDKESSRRFEAAEQVSVLRGWLHELIDPEGPVRPSASGVGTEAGHAR